MVNPQSLDLVVTLPSFEDLKQRLEALPASDVDPIPDRLHSVLLHRAGLQMPVRGVAILLNQAFSSVTDGDRTVALALSFHVNGYIDALVDPGEANDTLKEWMRNAFLRIYNITIPS